LASRKPPRLLPHKSLAQNISWALLCLVTLSSLIAVAGAAPRMTRSFRRLAICIVVQLVAAYRVPSMHIMHAARRSTVPFCKAPEFTFELNQATSSIKFGCRQQTVTMVRPEPAGSLQEFIGSEVDAIILSSWDAGKVSRCEGTEDEYKIKVEEFDFVALKFAVELRMRCTLDKRTTTSSLESLGFRLIGPGLEKVADAIDVRVKGRLRPSAPDARICALSGDVEFIAEGELPPVLRAAPEPALRAASRAMSQALISAAAERFSQRVPKAYAKWASGRR